MSSPYRLLQKTNKFPRLPLEGMIDLTYRCNNHCRHCWLWVGPDDARSQKELSFDEIQKIAEEARRMGCRKWFISGGEPMLRPDFVDIFDFLTSQSGTYVLNTNGTLIMPKIARLLKRKGNKLVALYGATAEVHDHITRSPGSFEATMRGFRYLQEAGASFTVQLVPMRDNYSQFEKMKELALSLSKSWRVGAAWFYLSAERDPQVNKEIMAQRLLPHEAVAIIPPNMSFAGMEESHTISHGCGQQQGTYLFGSCIEQRRDFHIDPYGGITFCIFIKDPAMRYDLRRGNFKEAWEEFIPSLAQKIPMSDQYRQQCGSCSLRGDCRACPVYAYLEHGDYQEKVDYLCAVAKESRQYAEDWLKHHRRYFQIAGISLEVNSDIPIKDDTFSEAIKSFEVQSPGDDRVVISHHFELLDLKEKDLGREIYRHPPWAIYRKGNSWIYVGILSDAQQPSFDRVVVFNHDHTKARIHHDKNYRPYFEQGGVASVSFLPTDQILIARLLADRQGCYLHSCGVDWKGRGYLFAGHSGAGKSTMAQMLAGHAELLCDDRIIVRKREDGFKIYGTWHHGTEPQVSAGSASLRAIFFLHQSLKNKAQRMEDRKEIVRRLLAFVIKPLVTVDWWEKTLSLIECIAAEVPCYELLCDKSGNVVKILESI